MDLGFLFFRRMCAGRFRVKRSREADTEERLGRRYAQVACACSFKCAAPRRERAEPIVTDNAASAACLSSDVGQTIPMTSLAKNQWSVGHGTLRGRTVHFSVNRALEPIRTAGSHPFEARFAFDVLSPAESGLPAADELAALQKIEDELVPALEATSDTYLGAVVTSDGIRDLIFYTRSPDTLVRHFEEKMKPTATRPVELFIERNDWRAFQLFASAEEPNQTPEPMPLKRHGSP